MNAGENHPADGAGAVDLEGPRAAGDSLREVAPFLPMIYVAWADGELDAAEIRAVGKAAREAAPGDPSVRCLLERWLDPESPPGPVELALLLDGIEEAARRAGLGSSDRVDLAGLGLAIAEVSEGVSEVERDGLLAVQAALGIDGGEAARQLLSTGRPGAEPYRAQPSFDVEQLAALLDEPCSATRRRVRQILQRPDFAPPAEPTRAEYRALVLAWLQELADEGLGALGFAEEHGGRGDPAAFVATFETLAEGDLSLQVKFGVQFGLFGGSIQQLGTHEHHRRYLPDIGTAELPGCFAMTETGHGSNVADIETTATWNRDDDTFVVHTPHPGAIKNYIGNAALHGRLATVFAQLRVEGADHGVHALLVPIRDERGQPLPGVTIEDDGLKLGLNGVDNGRLAFDAVSVPRENLLDRFASVSEDGEYTSPIGSASARFFTMLGTLVGGRVSVGASAVAVSKTALSIAVRYANRRRQFGPPGEPEFTLLDYLSHQERLLPRLARTYALHFALRSLAALYVESMTAESEAEGEEVPDRRELEARAAALKALATWHATDTVQECREACGGQGYLAENRFAALKRDSDIFTTFEGDNTVLLQLVAKGLLSRYRKQFHDMTLRRAVRYAAGRLARRIGEGAPALTGRDPETLRSREFQLELFEHREQHLLESLALRLKQRIDDGMEASRAVIEVQDHMIELARAHGEHLVLREFVAAIDRAPSELRPPLEKLRTLWGLCELERDRGWFLEQGALEPRVTKAIRGEVNALLGEVRPQAEHLVDAWNMPRQWVDVPITS